MKAALKQVLKSRLCRIHCTG